MTTTSERATSLIKRPGIGHNQPPQTVSCPSCGATFDARKAGKPRSIEQHKRFFAIVKAAFEHWPEAHEEQFATVDALRGWLTMKAGPEWREEVCRVSAIGMKIDTAVMLATTIVATMDERCRVVQFKGNIVILKPKSIRFDRMTHMAFCALNDAVADVIKEHMHVTADELLQMGESA